ncbi:9378_t:CDS:2 [Gigaspora rosea]|nr:9378_t:CDS:2 [Gigaspora rosea]
MASTSNVKKSSTQRSSQSSNYNDHQSQPRQILPMSRQSTQSRVYSQALQPQVIVPTQYDDITSNNVPSSKDLTSSMHYPHMEYGNYQTSYFGPVHPYSTSFNNSLHHHYQHMRPSQMDQTLASIFCSECLNNIRNISVTSDTNILQSICKQCRDKFTNPNIVALIQQSARAVSGNMTHPMTQSMSVTSRSHSMSHQVNRSLSLVVPTQHSTTLDQYPMTSHSTDSQTDLQIDYQNISYNNGVVNDVFFSDPMINDTIELHFDSDASSDTDILTPNPHYSPNLSPIEMDG